MSSKYELDIKALAFKRGILKEKLQQCTEPQVQFFNRLYISIEKIPEKKMDWAYKQILKTLELNRKKQLNGEK